MANQSSSYRKDGIDIVREVDGSPSISRVHILEVSNGTLMSPGPGVARVSSGGGAGDENEYFERVNFDYQTPSPMILQGLGGGELIDAVTLVIETPFDDAAAALACGLVATPNAVFAPNEVLPGTAAQYEFDMKLEVIGAEFLRLLITPAGATQGEGYVLFRIRK